MACACATRIEARSPHYRACSAIRGHQKQSEAISVQRLGDGRQMSSEVIRGHQRQSAYRDLGMAEEPFDQGHQIEPLSTNIIPGHSARSAVAPRICISRMPPSSRFLPRTTIGAGSMNC